MATTLMPLDPATSPQRANRVLTISARLLPAEIVAGRRARRMRAAVITGLVIVLALLGSWVAYASYQTGVAREDLEAVTQEARDLRQKQTRFAAVVNVQGETSTLKKQLSDLLVNDLRWSALLNTLSGTGAPSAIVIGDVNGQLLTKADTAAAGAGLPSTSTDAVVGRLTVTGTAPSKPDLARYVEALGKLTVIANPYLTSVTQAKGETAVEFSMQLDITSDALGGRFTAKKAGGK